MNQNLNGSKCAREKELLTALPFSKSTLWRKVKDGTFPKPIKLSEKVTVWEVAEVEAWLDNIRNSRKA